MQNKPGRILTILFAVLCAVNFGYLILGFLSIPGYFQRTTTLTVPRIDIPYANYPTNESLQQGAVEHGMTLAQFAIEQIAFRCAVVLFFMAVAFVIVIRARGNWYAWYSAFFLIFIAEFAFYDQVYVAHLLPIWIFEAGALFWPLILLYFFLFPNGKLVPRKALWGVGPFLLFHLFVQASGFLSLFFPNLLDSSFWGFILGPGQNIIFVAFLVILGCQIYRYRKVSTREEKLQTRWFVVGLAFFITLSIISESFGNQNPYRDEVSLLIFIFMPISVGVAILRYRLWDIDLIIRRTLLYGLLTVLLGMVYFGMVVLLEQVFRAVTGQESPLAVVLSTLVIVVLFTPLRRGLQAVIDRRFFRQKYNAEQTVATFAAVARNETALDAITGQMVSVVEETVQPEQVWVWLKDGSHKL